MAWAERTYPSLDALMCADERGEISDDDFDDELWLHLSDRFGSPQELEGQPHPALVYMSSRWVEWEVGNGGFAQAVYNVLEWFEPAANAFDELGLAKAADLIRKAKTVAESSGEVRGEKFDADQIWSLFQQFSESTLSELDDKTDEVDFWSVNARRLDYVRANRNAFRSIKT